jgi:hypothetical protein
MAKQAVAATMNDTLLAGVTGNISGDYWGGGPVETTAGLGPQDWALSRLAKLGVRTAAQHAFHMRRQNVHVLDPDLAGNRSMALHAKIRLQREREYWRSINGERGYLEAQIAGWFE